MPFPRPGPSTDSIDRVFAHLYQDDVLIGGAVRPGSEALIEGYEFELIEGVVEEYDQYNSAYYKTYKDLGKKIINSFGRK